MNQLINKKQSDFPIYIIILILLTKSRKIQLKFAVLPKKKTKTFLFFLKAERAQKGEFWEGGRRGPLRAFFFFFFFPQLIFNFYPVPFLPPCGLLPPFFFFFFFIFFTFLFKLKVYGFFIKKLKLIITTLNKADKSKQFFFFASMRIFAQNNNTSFFCRIFVLKIRSQHKMLNLQNLQKNMIVLIVKIKINNIHEKEKNLPRQGPKKVTFLYHKLVSNHLLEKLPKNYIDFAKNLIFHLLTLPQNI
eukprot:TRINITY_DN384_c0_g1_i8.p1 TRINITY_DN384_c0_g1~~TRINITY_DN384_c0_g1_i8.p1  ORF type:complete len:246 (-),score=24.76 TRINITY_DN384_c0_g1_i8:272-1009(-)